MPSICGYSSYGECSKYYNKRDLQVFCRSHSSSVNVT